METIKFKGYEWIKLEENDGKTRLFLKNTLDEYTLEKCVEDKWYLDGCIIGIGKGNDDWNCSAPHGAGRIMSRMQAKQTFNLDEYKKSMENIYTTSVNENTIDEVPFVYKPMQEIIDNIRDTVDIIKIIKPIYNFKANE